MTYIIIALLAVIALWSVWGFFGSRVEQTGYAVVKKMNGYEIREYPAHIVAQTTVKGSYGKAMNSGFSILAGYIFGGNTKKEGIAMTAPVVAQKGEAKKASENIAMTAPVMAAAAGDSHTISFGMPRSYTLETLPTPDDPRIKIMMIPTKKYAVMRFSWHRSDARVKSGQEKLLLALTRDGVAAEGSAAYAGYNAPWTPPWMTRHEVLVEVKYEINQTNILSEEEKRVIIDKGTEAPFSGEYVNTAARGVYVCRQCGAPLYNSADKFESGCGWPSFDDEIKGAVKKSPDADGARTEITCARCGGHLGHVFTGERLTEKNIRHCVNSISMKFIPSNEHTTKKIVLAGGCFWGLEELVRKQPGVIGTVVGYTGGQAEDPVYENHEGHAEAVEIAYDPEKTSYRKLLDFFFRIHNPTTLNRQGNDSGASYRSAIFHANEEEKKEAENFIKIVNTSKRWKDPVVTTLEPLKKFYPAEDYHQDYLKKNPGGYTCHAIYFDSYIK